MKKLSLIIAGLVMTSIAFAQTTNLELESSAGDSFNNTSYQLDWSIGECVTTTHSAGSYVLTQGFHQYSYEITTNLENSLTEIQISAYPNPTTDFISLQINSFKSSKGDVILIVTDLNGRVLQEKEMLSDLEQISFSNYAAGTYFIAVRENNQLIKSFKIIKN